MPKHSERVSACAAIRVGVIGSHILHEPRYGSGRTKRLTPFSRLVEAA